MPDRAPTDNPETNGVVTESVEFEETGRVVQLMTSRLAAGEGGDPDLARALARLFESRDAQRSGGDGGDGNAKTIKEIKRAKWLAPLLALIFGSGGMVGTFYALKAQAESNTSQVESLNKSVHGTDHKIGLDDRVEQTEENIRLIKVRVGTIDKNVKSIETSQTIIQGGIDQLKNEAQTEKQKRLQDELDEARRELRRRDRLDR